MFNFLLESLKIDSERERERKKKPTVFSPRLVYSSLPLTRHHAQAKASVARSASSSCRREKEKKAEEAEVGAGSLKKGTLYARTEPVLLKELYYQPAYIPSGSGFTSLIFITLGPDGAYDLSVRSDSTLVCFWIELNRPLRCQTERHQPHIDSLYISINPSVT